MAKKTLLSTFIFALSCYLFFLEAHEGHSLLLGDSDLFLTLFSSLGRFHLIFLHFPIALIIMTVVAEWLWIWFGNSLFSQAARFMIFAAAIFAPITALLGLAYGYGHTYQGLSLDLFIWHRYFGIITAGLAILTALLRERYARQHSSSLTGYYISLFLLFLCISLTGAFGGSLTFGLDVW